MAETSGIELSLLEGMDEALLTRLHHEGIHTRADLEPRIAGPVARERLAAELGVPARRLKTLHHLNFLLPEERAERFLDLERRVSRQDLPGRDDFTRLRRTVLGLFVANVVLVILAVVFLRSTSDGPVSSFGSVEDRIETVEAELDALRPLGAAHAESMVMRALSGLGPAPGWNGPLGWAAADDRRVRLLLGNAGNHQPERAVSLAILRLAALENAPLDSLSPGDRGRAAAALAAEFPEVTDLAGPWDAAAVLLRARFRSRSLGLAPLDGRSPQIRAALAWRWTSPAFLTCEELVTRLESLRVTEDALPVWSSTLVQLREAADLGWSRHEGSPESFARDYWLRRGELEVAVVAALLGRSNLLPYHRLSPIPFLEQRKRFLEKARERAPRAAKEPLSWLLVEYEEALRLVAWLEDSPSERAEGGWLETLTAVEGARRDAGLAPGLGVARKAGQAAAFSGETETPWTSARTQWEAGLRPLLMETRYAISALAPAPGSPS